MDGVQIDPAMEVAIITDARSVRALLDVLQRIPMTALESVAIEKLFENWFAQIRDQAAQASAMSKIAELAKLAGDGAAGDVPSDDPPVEDYLAGTPAAMNDATLEHTPDASSGPLPYAGSEGIVN